MRIVVLSFFVDRIQMDYSLKVCEGTVNTLPTGSQKRILVLFSILFIFSFLLIFLL